MASFAESMKGFTEHLQSSIQERGDALTRINGATGLLLDDTKEFMSDVAHDHRTMAAELRATLDAQRVEQSERVATLRHHHREALRQIRDDLRQMLDASNQSRREALHQLRETFHQAQHELADDLREASSAWREFAAGRS